jgi:hypothetical protein
MQLLRIPPAIGKEYNEAIDKLIVTYNKNRDKILQNQPEYDKLCARLLALEAVILHHFFEAEDKQGYLTKTDDLLGDLYLGLSAGAAMNCYPLETCGNRCCFGAEVNI